MKKIDMPYDTDSELQEFRYTIPEGYTAEIVDGEVIIKKAESEDEKTRKNIIATIQQCPDDYLNPKNRDRMLAWLEKQKEQKPVYGAPGVSLSDCSDEVIRAYYDGYNKHKDEQKSSSTEDMPYITDEHFYEREPADSFKYKLAEYMTKNCRKEEGPYGYTYGISAESILKMAEEELLKRGVVQKPAEKAVFTPVDTELTEFEKAVVKLCQIGKDEYPCYEFAKKYAPFLLDLAKKEFEKPAEWSEEDEEHLNRIDRALVILETESPNINISDERDWLKSLRPQPKQEWSEEDKEMISSIEQWLHEEKPEYVEKELAWLESLRPPQYCENCRLKRSVEGWKPSKEQMKALNGVIGGGSFLVDHLITLYHDLKKL